jgi:hypothetical protein
MRNDCDLCEAGVAGCFDVSAFSEAIIAKKRLRLSLDKGCEKGVFRLMEQIEVKIRLAVPTTA